MMKASDFAPAATPSEIAVDSKFMTGNAKNAGLAVDWKKSRIAETRGSCESRPYGRDAAVAAHAERKKLHRALDALLSDIGYDEGPVTRKMHDALDMAMDAEGSESAYASGRKVSRDRAYAKDIGYIADAEYVAEFLNPRQFCSDARHDLYNRAYEGQRDPQRRGYWAGLIHFLSNAPDGARVRDLNQVTLSTLLQKVSA